MRDTDKEDTSIYENEHTHSHSHQNHGHVHSHEEKRAFDGWVHHIFQFRT